MTQINSTRRRFELCRSVTYRALKFEYGLTRGLVLLHVMFCNLYAFWCSLTYFQESFRGRFERKNRESRLSKVSNKTFTLSAISHTHEFQFSA